MCRLTIIIPFLGQDKPFEATLVSVLEARSSGCEVIVVDNGRYQDPYDIGDEVRFTSCSGNVSLLNQLNHGCDEAKADVIHFLQPGLKATSGWLEAAMTHFENPLVGCVAPAILDPDGAHFLAGVSYGLGGTRSVTRLPLGSSVRNHQSKLLGRNEILGPTLFAGFYRRSFFQLCGGFDASVGKAYADVDLALSLSDLGFHATCEPNSLLVPFSISEERPNSLVEGRTAERLFWRHAQQHPQKPPLLRHLCAVMGDLVTSLPHRSLPKLLGRAMAYAEKKSYRQFAAQMAESAKIAEFLIAKAERRQQAAHTCREPMRRAA